MITLTEAAAQHIKKSLEKRGKGLGIRLGVERSGCNGFAYKLEFADETKHGDSMYEQFGVKVLVDARSLPYIDGTELDFVKEGLEEGFRFANPNLKERCGCGESFTV
jgi:iron-sulfur cluster assembly protein